jgi:hypothetical protein
MVHDEVTITALEIEFPGWRVWRSADSWWATRRGPEWMSEPRTVAADTAESLRGELRDVLGTVPEPAQGLSGCARQ